MLDRPEFSAEHLLISPRPEGCWVAVARGVVTPTLVDGQPFERGMVQWGHNLQIGSVRMVLNDGTRATAAKGGKTEKKEEKVSPVLLVVAVIVLGFAGYSLLSTPAGQEAPERPRTPPPPLFDEAARPCSQTAPNLLTAAAESLGASEVVTPGVGLKDGILAELVKRSFSVWDERGEQAEVEAEAVELGRKYRFDEAHAKHVAGLATSLFDQFADLHRLGTEERTLLRLAAILHDAGDFIGFESHHKHTYYLIVNSDLMGVSPANREVIANVARYHRKSLPDLSHPGYRKLDRRERTVVRKLAALLRVADAFDREHQGKVQDIHVRITPGRIGLRATPNPANAADVDLSLERWTAQRKADLMEEVFECDVKVDGAEGISLPRAFR
jgi:hypothetical protein